MTGEPLDPTPAAPGADTGGTAPPPSPPAPAAQEQAADDADFDLLDADGGDADAGGEGADGGDTQDSSADADAERPAWQRPDGLEGDDLIEWKEQLGLPVDAAGYEIELDLREGESVTETGQQLLDGLKEFAVEHDLPPPAVSKLAQWYDAQIKAQNAKLAETDKELRTETREALSDRWGQGYAERMDLAKEGARVLPTALRAMLRVARTPDGKRIAHTAEFAQALFEIGRLRTRKGNTPVPTTDDQRRAEIEKVMNTDIDRYRREGLDKEFLALARKRETPVRTGTLTAAEESEERELIQHMSEDIDSYNYRQWRGLGKTGSDRLMELRRKRAGESA